LGEHGPDSLRGLCRGRLLAKAFGVARGTPKPSGGGLCKGGFTLLELLVVIGIIATLLVLIGPAFTTITRGTDVSSAIYGVKGVLENARAYAKANHTCVFVGLTEVDSSVDPLVSPQITTGDTPYGRVAVAVVASKDGTSQYQYATTGQLAIAMALISLRLGNYRHTRIYILCRLILDRGVPLRIRTPKWQGINRPVHRTFWATRFPAR